MISRKIKKIFIFIPILFLSRVFADSYKIKNVHFNITGMTREYALLTKVNLDKKKIFKTEDSLVEYLEDYKHQIENTRAFESVTIDFTLEKSEESHKVIKSEIIDGILTEYQEDESVYNVMIEVSTKDTFHILGMPYPKYDSNSGFVLKIKFKDTNFFGSLETLSSDLNFAIESKNESTPEYKFGFNIDFDIPFKMGIFNSVLTNQHEFSYTIGDATPEWNLNTGLQIELPLSQYSIKMSFTQSFIRNFDYEDADVNGNSYHYGDGTYFVEKGILSVPIIIQDVQDWGKIYYTPYFEGKLNWDFDGISKLNQDLMSPVLTIGQTLSTERINWIENFRNGLSISITQSFAYNVQREVFIPGISGELKMFKAFKYFALSSDIYAFAYLNNDVAFGSRLRGIRDEQYYSKSTTCFDQKACESPAAIVINLDCPIHIYTFRWDEMTFIMKIPFVNKIAKYFNFELQISPFVDIALSKNRSSGYVFNMKDGFYAGGLEVILYPLKWKSFQVRGSFGIDLGQKMPGLKDILTQDWRDSKAYEISIGIGLLY